MEQDIDHANGSASKRRSRCFSNLLRGRKVGCFNMEKSMSGEPSENVINSDNATNGNLVQINKSDVTIDEESKITNVTLCCAITDTGKTPVTFRCIGNTTECTADSYQRSDKPDKLGISYAEQIDKVELEDINGKSNKSRNGEEVNSSATSDKINKYNCAPYFNEIIKEKVMLKSCLQNSSSVPESHKFSKSNDKHFYKSKYRPRSMSALPRRATSLDSLRHESLDSSLESLIKHSIANSRIIYPVSVSKAKDRNYLHGKTGALCLLGTSELERVFPEREVRIYICTWNMNGEAPPSDLGELFLPSQMETLPDIFVIGTQESYSDTSEWEISMQETIGPSHVLFHSETLGTLYMGVFIRRELIWFCSEPEDTSFSTRPGSAFKTKGAVAICFYLFGSSFLFITSHLTAHDDKVRERISDVKRICNSLELPKDLPIRHKNKDVTQNFDYVFWFGDLNFRLTQPRAQVIDWLSKQKFPLDSPLQTPLYDQLASNIRKGLVFKGFQEPPLSFKPTYKYDPGTQDFDTSHKQRVPSYTDRILYRCKKGNILNTGNNTNIHWLHYSSVPSFTTSDHKPVWGLYKCKLKPGSDSIPLAAGLFNREVYLDGLKRRASTRKGSDDSSVCVIQ